MGLLARRRQRKAAAHFEEVRARHEAFLRDCELLCDWNVKFDLSDGRVSVFGCHADGLTEEEREWLDTYMALGYIVKVLFNLGPHGRQLWPDVLSRQALSPAVVEAHLSFTNAPSYTGDVVTDSEATAVYNAQVYRKAEGLIPFLQTPYEPADGSESLLAPWSLAALLTCLRSQQDDVRRPIDLGIKLLEAHRVEGDWEPGEQSHQIELMVMFEMAQEGVVPDGLMPADHD
jgi:hypothetical protein